MMKITGPRVVSCYYPAVWTSTLLTGDLTTPITYLWEWSTTGVNNWNTLSTSSSTFMSQLAFPSGGFFLHLKITDGRPSYGSTIIRVFVPYCNGYPEEETTIISEIGENEITIFPNPTSGIVHINGPGITHIKSISIVDNNGRLLKEEPIFKNKGSAEIDLRFLGQGIYF